MSFKLVNNDAHETNSGKFMEIIRLLSDCDILLFKNLQNMLKKHNKVNFLSNKSQNEIINLISSIVKKIFSKEIKLYISL